jgi:hypothetical protein
MPHVSRTHHKPHERNDLLRETAEKLDNAIHRYEVAEHDARHMQKLADYKDRLIMQLRAEVKLLRGKEMGMAKR